jgi:hypothetical protein
MIVTRNHWHPCSLFRFLVSSSCCIIYFNYFISNLPVPVNLNFNPVTAISRVRVRGPAAGPARDWAARERPGRPCAALPRQGRLTLRIKAASLSLSHLSRAETTSTSNLYTGRDSEPESPSQTPGPAAKGHVAAFSACAAVLTRSFVRSKLPSSWSMPWCVHALAAYA